MGILDAGIDLLKGIKEFISDEPFDVGLRFEKYVADKFSQNTSQLSREHIQRKLIKSDTSKVV